MTWLGRDRDPGDEDAFEAAAEEKADRERKRAREDELARLADGIAFQARLERDTADRGDGAA